jgi:hypothetical protein
MDKLIGHLIIQARDENCLFQSLGILLKTMVSRMYLEQNCAVCVRNDKEICSHFIALDVIENNDGLRIDKMEDYKTCIGRMECKSP